MWHEKCLYNTIIMQKDDYWHNIILPVSYLLGKLEVCIISSICSDTAWHVIGLGEICINIQSQLSWCGVANKHGLGVLFCTADVHDKSRHIAVTRPLCCIIMHVYSPIEISSIYRNHLQFMLMIILVMVLCRLL